MARVQQIYDGSGVPLRVAGTPDEIAGAWSTHRARLRGWLADLPESEWSRPTRCSAWDVTGLVAHLVSGAQFLGYTLHQAQKGVATRLLDGFDAQETPAATAAMFAGLSRTELLAALDDVDSRIAAGTSAFTSDDWQRPAEGPAGRIPAYVAVNHFLFDSWVHERDLMVPAGDEPLTDRAEVSMVASYIVGLAGVARGIDDAATGGLVLDLRLTDVDVDIHAVVSEQGTTATLGAAGGGLSLSGTAADVVDFATGRASAEHLMGDPETIAFLRHLAELLA